MRCRTLKKASRDNLIRLAIWLGLRVPNTMSTGQLVRLIKWRTAGARFDNMDYDLAIHVEGAARERFRK